MVLARNTYRFALLLVGYAVASGLDDIGAYHSQGIALLALGIGGFALFVGTLAHYVPEGRDADGGDGATGGDNTGRIRDDRDDDTEGGPDDTEGGPDVDANGPQPGSHAPWGRY